MGTQQSYVPPSPTSAPPTPPFRIIRSKPRYICGCKQENKCRNSGYGPCPNLKPRIRRKY